MAEERTVNGVNVAQLFDTIETIKKNPEVAKFKFRSENSWINGTYNRATIRGFFGALKENDGRQVMFDVDEPPLLLGANRGANPVEYLLVALSGCLTTSMVAHAAAKGFEIRSIQSRLEGDLDLRGFLGIDESVPVGYQSIRVYFTIDAPSIDEEQKKELIRMAQKYSPVYNTITNTTPVSVSLEK